MKMDAGLDTGPLISRREVSIQPGETGGELSERLSPVGAELLLETLPGYLDGSLTPMPQDNSLATFAGMLKKADGALNLEADADYLARQVRAFNPWPGTFFDWKGLPLKVHQARAQTGQAPIGSRLVRDGLPALATCDGLLVLEQVQPAGKRVMSGEIFLNGARDWETP